MADERRESGIDGRKRKRRRRASVWRLAVATFFVAVCAFLCVTSLAHRSYDFSRNENRSLAQRPALSREALADGSFFADTESWFMDQFSGRDGWIGMNYYVKRMLGMQESGGVLIDRAGNLYARPTEPDEAALARTVAGMNQLAESRPDIPQRMILVPDAAAVYPERLPKGAPVRDQNADIAEFTESLDDRIRIVDVGEALRSVRDEQIFYRTDHHWTSLGAYRVFQAASAELGINYPGMYGEVLVANNFHGTLASMSGSTSRSDEIYIYEAQGTEAAEYYVNYPDTLSKSATMFDVEKLEEKDQYTVFFGGNHPVVEITSTANNGRNLLVLKDSYANCFMQFLVPHYEKIVMIDPRYCYESVETLLDRYDSKEILYLYSADILFEDTSLADLLGYSE